MKKKKRVNSMNKLVESNIPKSVKIVLAHFHKGNSSNSARKGHQYMTLCKLYDRETHLMIGHGESHCSRKDLASRSIGRQVAIGRAMKEAGLKTPPEAGLKLPVANV